MRRILSVLFLIILFGCTQQYAQKSSVPQDVVVQTNASQNASVKNSNQEMSEYENSHIRMKYPSDWKVIEGDPIRFFSSFESREPVRAVYIIVEDTTFENMTFEEYTNYVINKLSSDTTKTNINVQNSTLGGRQAKAATFDSISEPKMRVFLVWARNNNKIYNFEYVTLDTDYDRYTQEANRMLDSFEFTD